jgi:stage II sporulation protein D
MQKMVAPLIHVGILLAERVQFRLEGTGPAEASVREGHVEVLRDGLLIARDETVTFSPGEGFGDTFRIRDVVIGIGFHWEQKEEQRFKGALKLVASGLQVQVVNMVSVEDYLVSVISSEMRGDSAPALLKAHTIISRSWLLAQIEKQESPAGEGAAYSPIRETDKEYTRWYDREDHTGFHVCADDHCQRYQGITRASNPEVVRAVKETTGEVLAYGGRICDARFSKCCGGVTEQFEYCWEPDVHPYLQRVDDHPVVPEAEPVDLKVEANAIRFISGRPDAFCNTDDAALLGQVLNDYDQASSDFYRWKVVCDQEEMARLIRERSGVDFGAILDLVPVTRGESGRLVQLKIVGTKRTMTIGKELEIRRWLSSSHLYSAAFFVEKGKSQEGVPQQFILRGAGWGHGVGLCQIGAAVMASKGYSHTEILMHYYKDVSIEKRYG